MELIMQRALELLRQNLKSTLAQVDDEFNGATGTTLATPEIPAANYHLTDRAAVTAYPACHIYGRRGAPGSGPGGGYEDWKYTLEIEVYQTGASAEDLARTIARYAEAVKRIMRNPDLWGGPYYNPVVSGVFYSNVIPDETGFLRACRVNVDINIFEGVE